LKTDYRHGLAFAILVALCVTMFPSASRSQANPAEAANNLVAALAKDDIAGAALYTAAADRERFVSIMQAQDRMVKARDRFQQTVNDKLPKGEMNPALLARRARQRVDHIVIVAQRDVSPDVVDLDVKSYGIGGGPPSSLSTWQAVRENGQWRLHLPPCASAAAAAPIVRRYDDMAAATEAVTVSIQKGQISDFADAHLALIKAGHEVLRTGGARQ
jgi:hypothetical protein